jgi:hypothetical protein
LRQSLPTIIWHGHRDSYSSGHGQSNCALRKILGWPPVTARSLGPKGPGSSIIWEDFEISTPCTKCFKPQLAWNQGSTNRFLIHQTLGSGYDFFHQTFGDFHQTFSHFYMLTSRK